MCQEQDAEVAVKLFGWRYGRSNDRQLAFPPDWVASSVAYSEVPFEGVRQDFRTDLPAYTTDAAADFEVLKRVRETWKPWQVCAVRDEMTMTFERRAWEKQKAGELDTIWGLTQYLPGDWSRAALSVLKANKESEAPHA